MFNRLLKDSFLLGIFIGIIPLAIGYYTLLNYDEVMTNTGVLKIKLYPPRLQLIILALTMILFRFMIVKWEMIKTGKGLFIIIFIATLFYFFNERYKIF